MAKNLHSLVFEVLICLTWGLRRKHGHVNTFLNYQRYKHQKGIKIHLLQVSVGKEKKPSRKILNGVCFCCPVVLPLTSLLANTIQHHKASSADLLYPSCTPLACSSASELNLVSQALRKQRYKCSEKSYLLTEGQLMKKLIVKNDYYNKYMHASRPSISSFQSLLG